MDVHGAQVPRDEIQAVQVVVLVLHLNIEPNETKK